TSVTFQKLKTYAQRPCCRGHDTGEKLALPRKQQGSPNIVKRKDTIQVVKAR
ncbi:6684_t:CDS:2, partial [Funneliformis caledonium]